MDRIHLFHNKRCSKSNQALNYLKEKGISEDEIDVILYMDEPLSKETTRYIVDLLSDQLDELIRKPDAKKLGISMPEKLTKSWVAEHILKEPKIMQRPIVIVNGKAVIARPTERIDEIVEY
ncbi:MAG: hypothetical protein KF704_09065 [Crocinitomicaceae bacterium]|nr:hypothetical protein [Crocinitomicaceae bacterium]NGF74489.1 arsenate reductase (glutaredoxin) [Fluviicola sp. SGL-29]